MKNNKAIPILILVFSIVFAAAVQTQAQQRKPRSSKYKNMPRIGQKVQRMPRATVIVKHKGIPYHYKSGVFYRPRNNAFYVVHAPIGVRVRVLPANYFRLTWGSGVYFYYYGTFYEHRGGYYETVAPPLGARVDELPNGYYQVVIDGNTYYVADGIYYKAILDDNGAVWYEVVGINSNEIND